MDLRPWFEWAAYAASIPLQLAVACAIAESGLFIQAARYGTWPDVSFGLGQRIVLYHYVGDRTNTPENIEYVRQFVWDHPDVDIWYMCQKLASNLHSAGGDLLQALIAYNSGSIQPAGNWYWQKYPNNIANYRAALDSAADLLRRND